MTFLFPTIRKAFFIIWYESYLKVKGHFWTLHFWFCLYSKNKCQNIFIIGHFGLFDARLVPYGGILVFMRIDIGIAFVIPIDIFDRLDYFDCQKSDYKK